MWLKELKIAIVEKNTDKLNSLMENLPELTTKEDIDSAICLLKEATDLVTSFRDETEASMIQMKKNIKFLKATESKRPSKLDIKL
mgnify:CR=1 FL=1